MGLKILVFRVRLSEVVPNNKGIKMKLFNRIKVDQLGLRLEGTPESKRNASFLTTLIGELETDLKNGKPPTEGAVIAKIKKVITNNNNTIKLLDGSPASIAFGAENLLLSTYLPRQLTLDDLDAIVAGLCTTDMGRIMGYLKKNFAGQYDGKLAAQAAREFFK